jgi:hypothetical protein
MLTQGNNMQQQFFRERAEKQPHLPLTIDFISLTLDTHIISYTI